MATMVAVPVPAAPFIAAVMVLLVLLGMEVRPVVVAIGSTIGPDQAAGAQNDDEEARACDEERPGDHAAPPFERRADEFFVQRWTQLIPSRCPARRFGKWTAPRPAAKVKQKQRR
jgi:xanthosine utilization system XapX-like protein